MLARYSAPMSARADRDGTDIERVIRDQLGHIDRLRGASVDADERQHRLWLKGWQARRLAQTHAALLDEPRYRPAAQFFLSDLYGPRDHRSRDRDVARVLPTLLKLLPAAALDTLAQGLRMDCISELLDAELARCARAQGALRHEADLTMAQYVQAYRACGQPALRAEQLALILQIGQSLDGLTRKPMLATTLRLSRRPAELAGLGELHGFLQRGFTAFAHMQGADEFLHRIVSQEQALMRDWLKP